MELKEYQSAALDAFGRWRDALSAANQEIAEAAQSVESLLKLQSETGLDAGDVTGRNYPKLAWHRLAQQGGVPGTAGPYVSRTDDAGRPIPHVCFKVPTGGGKTLLAAASLHRLQIQNSLVLWITPTTAIYQQTKKALRNREHPYRQMLDHASNGRIKLLEKDDKFNRGDIAHYLCIMLLMLPAANRQRGKDFLRMFRDSGNYPTLFPDNDTQKADGPLLEKYPDLERWCMNPACPAKEAKPRECTCDNTWKTGPVKHSLFNVFKMLRPVVVLDEAHKAYGRRDVDRQEFVRSVNRLDPRMVIELSATPHSAVSNLLVDITGGQLKQEHMVKLPVNVAADGNTDWQHTLDDAHKKLEELAGEAVSLQHANGRYIRPIAVVRVERTGTDQRGGVHLHAEDVRDHLHRLGIPEDAVAVQSSTQKELTGQDLLSGFSPIRWIITKDALMEGWDCSFAYVLATLDNTRSSRALTQLVGRVMRQPEARRTGREPLDQCYVYCRYPDVGKAVRHVKEGLQQEGMGDLENEVVTLSEQEGRVTLRRREPFRGKPIYLPKVLHQGGAGWQELDYRRHILADVDWGAIDAPEDMQGAVAAAERAIAVVDVDTETGRAYTRYSGEREVVPDRSVSVAWYVRRLTEVPNPWQAARIVQQLIARLREADQDDAAIFKRRNHYVDTLRSHVMKAIDQQGEDIFKRKLRSGLIRFDLEAGEPNLELKETYSVPRPETTSHLSGRNGEYIQLSLLEPVYEKHFDSDLERNFAGYLDEQKALQWWHRVAVRQRGDYYIRGWRERRIWPDFVAMALNGCFYIFETKGSHLDNEDTAYKEKVLAALEDAFTGGTMTIREGQAKGFFKLVFDADNFPPITCSESDYTP